MNIPPNLPTDTVTPTPRKNEKASSHTNLPKVTLTLLTCKFCSKVFNEICKLRRHELVDCKKDWTTNYN